MSRRFRNRGLQSSKGKGGSSGSSSSSSKSKKKKDGVSTGAEGEYGYDGGAATSSSQPFLILQSEHPGMCVGYLGSDVAQPVRLVSCTETKSDVTLWDKVEVTDNTYKLRHADSSMCLPQNPEFPSFPFDCFESLGGAEMASADSINGLVDCDSQYAAVLGTLNGQSSSGEVMLGLTSCMDMGQYIILMTYVDPDGSIIVLWGEEILLSLDDKDVQNYNLVPNFILGTSTS